MDWRMASMRRSPSSIRASSTCARSTADCDPSQVAYIASAERVASCSRVLPSCITTIVASAW